MREIKNIQEYQNLTKQGKLVLLDFFAEWCGPCQALMPTLKKFSEKNNELVEVAKINVDKLPDLASQYGVRSIPALFYVDNNEIVERLVGLQTESSLQASLDKLLVHSK